jgi:nucleoside 2-deoxyribosyltransferase
MTLYITSSFGDTQEQVEELCSIVRSAGFTDVSFIRDVEAFQKVFDDPRELMKRSEDEIRKTDALLIDMTDKPTGRAIEAGMAYSLGKRIVVIMKEGTKIKDTTRGIADAIIEYTTLKDISVPLKGLLHQWKK